MQKIIKKLFHLDQSDQEKENKKSNQKISIEEVIKRYDRACS